MKDQFVPYKLAVKLKELGFNEVCLAFYDASKAFTYSPNNNKIYTVKILAPLWQQAFDFFREKHGIHSYIERKGKFNWNFELTHLKRVLSGGIYDFKTYEEARQNCLEKLIELCLNLKEETE